MLFACCVLSLWVSTSIFFRLSVIDPYPSPSFLYTSSQACDHPQAGLHAAFPHLPPSSVATFLSLEEPPLPFCCCMSAIHPPSFATVLLLLSPASPPPSSSKSDARVVFGACIAIQLLLPTSTTEASNESRQRWSDGTRTREGQRSTWRVAVASVAKPVWRAARSSKFANGQRREATTVKRQNRHVYPSSHSHL